MRLIDADAFAGIVKEGGMIDEHATVVARNAMLAMPVVDAVPVVRCKDCKYYYEKEWVVGGGSYTTCWYQTIANAQPNDFCSRAERKEA